MHFTEGENELARRERSLEKGTKGRARRELKKERRRAREKGRTAATNEYETLALSGIIRGQKFGYYLLNIMVSGHLPYLAAYVHARS